MIEKALYRIEIVAMAYANNAEEALEAVRGDLPDIMDMHSEVHQVKLVLSDDWYNAIPYGKYNDDGTCGEIIRWQQRATKRPSPTYSTKPPALS